MIERFRQMPRALQWAAIAGAGIVLFLLWDSMIRPIGEEWDRKADRIESALTQSRDVEASRSRVEQLAGPILSLGPVELPRGTADALQNLNETVDAVLAGYKGKVGNTDFAIQTPSKLGRTALSELLSGNQIAQRVPATLRFEATPEDAIAIIAELEASPAIESITNVSLARAGGVRGAKKLSVQLTLEAWAIGTAPNTRGGGGATGGPLS
jgi:hypothetical protein